MFAYIDPHCGKPAFLFVEMPKPMSRIQSANARHLDGRRITPGSAPICDSCGRIVWKLSTKNVRPMNERPLVSRNKREGRYAGKDWRRRHHRSRKYFLGQPPDLSFIMFIHQDALVELKQLPAPFSPYYGRAQSEVGAMAPIRFLF